MSLTTLLHTAYLPLNRRYISHIHLTLKKGPHYHHHRNHHYHLHPANNLAKDNMLSIEPGGGGGGDEELGPIRVRPLVCHRQQTRPRNIGI